MEANATTASTAENRITKEVTVGKIEVSRVYKSQYQKEGTETAELKQTIETKSLYPTKSVTSNMQDNPFSDSEFGFEKTAYDAVETRVAWIDVPTGTTPEQVAAKLAALPAATLYKVLSNHPIISDNQANGISRDLTSKDIIGNSQAVRYPLNHPTLAGKLIPDVNGKVQYRSVYFKSDAKADMDLRTADVKDAYVTPEIQAELTPATAGVTADNIN